MSNIDQSSESACIRQYEMDTLLAEIAYFEKVTAASSGITAAALKNLQNRPHLVRLIESKFGGWLIGLLQHSIWAVKSRLPGKGKPVPMGTLPDQGSPEGKISPPDLVQTKFDESILTHRPKILIDTTPTFRRPESGGGIPRVVREFAKSAVETGLALPVYIENGELFSYFAHPALRGPIETDSDDIYVIVDIFWYFLDEYQGMLKSLHSKGTKSAVIVHDIFPLKFPSFYPEEVPPAFEKGLIEFLNGSDYCLSISKSGQNDIIEYFHSMKHSDMPRVIFDTIYLGAIQKADSGNGIRQSISDLFASDRVFLSVGTLEPRKGYGISLDACELAWDRGTDFSYVIIGRYGWRSEALRSRIYGHPEYGKRLFWIQDASDTELDFAYARCRSLVQSSIAEGFGLPLIEASQRGAPIIASDLPVFREIGGSELAYFPVGCPAGLSQALSECLAAPRHPAKIPLRSWSDSVRGLAACLAGRNDGKRPGETTRP